MLKVTGNMNSGSQLWHAISIKEGLQQKQQPIPVKVHTKFTLCAHAFYYKSPRGNLAQVANCPGLFIVNILRKLKPFLSCKFCVYKN